jgi:hypothetical protein
MEGLTAIVEAVLAGRGVDAHPADGVAHGRRTLGVMIVMLMAAGVIVAAAATGLGPFRRNSLGRTSASGLFCIAAFVGVLFGLVHHLLRRL